MSNFGYDEKTMINERIRMYREFHKQNPHVKGVGSVLTLIYLFRFVVGVIKILLWLYDIDQILLREYRVKQECVREGNFSDTRFSDELEQYLCSII